MVTNRKKTNVEYDRGYHNGYIAGQRNTKPKPTPIPNDTPEKLLQRQTAEKVTALFHKVHNLQAELQTSITESKRVFALLLRILERPEDRVDAAAELAREREQRIERFT